MALGADFRFLLYKQVLTVNDAQKLQSDLDSLHSWAETWLMKFNTSNCHKLNCTELTLIITCQRIP